MMQFAPQAQAMRLGVESRLKRAENRAQDSQSPSGGFLYVARRLLASGVKYFNTETRIKKVEDIRHFMFLDLKSF